MYVMAFLCRDIMQFPGVSYGVTPLIWGGEGVSLLSGSLHYLI